MTRAIDTTAIPPSEIHDLSANEQSRRENRDVLHGRNGRSAEDGRDYGRDRRERGSHGDAFEAVQSDSIAHFSRVMMQAAKRPSDDDGQDDDTTSEEGGVQVLFDSSLRLPTALNRDALSQVPSDGARIDMQIDQIVSRIDLHLKAAVRASHMSSERSTTFSLPASGSTPGLQNVAVTFTDTSLTVNLCFQTAFGGNEATSDLLAATAHLAQVLQGHLPGRRIRVVQSSGTANATSDITTHFPGDETGFLFGHRGQNS